MRTMTKVKDETESLIKNILEEGINTNNLQHLSDLVDIHKDIANEEYWCMKEESEDMYGNYGRDAYGRRGRDSYGRDSYGRDMYGMRDSRGRYRGHDYLDEMQEHYGRYMEDKSRYGDGEETDKSFHYMVKALEDFIKVLHEEAETPQQKQMLNDTLQRSMR